MKFIIDTKNNKNYEIENDKCEEFIEKYSNPQNLLVYDIWYCDGSGWNGKESKYASGTTTDDIIIMSTTNKHTNNYMEYKGIIFALKRCESQSIIFSDSQLAVNQINGLYKCNNKELKLLNIQAQAIIMQKNCIIDWKPREQNIVGIELDKQK